MNDSMVFRERWIHCYTIPKNQKGIILVFYVNTCFCSKGFCIALKKILGEVKMIKMITDSTSYIPEEWLKLYDIDVIPLSVILGEESFVETEISNEDFYTKLDASEHHPTSSQPSVPDMMEAS